MAAQAHRSDPRILGRRTLERDFRRLGELLRPGLAVLDVGCGTGAITAGIAKVVGPAGPVVGVDRDPVLVDLARAEHGSVGNLEFVCSDVTAALPDAAQFDIVASARTLQWIAEPLRAVERMVEAAKPGGMVVVFDYSHAANSWEPEPPGEFRKFYGAFLAWRQANGWDNRMADHLSELFRGAGLKEVESVRQDDVTARGDEDFAVRGALWSEVIGNVRDPLVGGGYCTEQELDRARECYDAWVEGALVKQTLAMCVVSGVC